MRAAVYRGRGQLEIEEVARPDPPGANEVQIRVTRAAVCGTDSTEWYHGPLLATPPVILGHEFTGVIDSVGPGVERFAPGDRVVAGAGLSCGTCAWCVAGRTNLCSSYETLGLHLDGGLAEYVNAPASNLLTVPDDHTDEEAALAQGFPLRRRACRCLRRRGVVVAEGLAHEVERQRRPSP